MPACTSSPFTLQPSALPHLPNFPSVHVDPDTSEKNAPPRITDIVIAHYRSFARTVSRTDSVASRVIASAPCRGSRSRSSRNSGTAPYCQDGIPRAAKGSRSCNWKPQYPHIKANTSLSSLPKLDLPPSPALFASSFPPFTPYVKISRSIQRTSRLGLFEDIWGLRTDRDAQPPDPGLLSVNEHTAPSSGFDVLHALKTTTHAIRSVLNYLLFFPNEHGHTQPRQGFPSVSLSTSEPQKRRVSSGKDHTDPLVRVRHPALDVLALLRELEESGRLPLSDDASDVGSDCSSQSRVELSHNGQSVVRLLRPTMRSCAHTLLVTFLLASLLPHVSSSPDRAEFLNAVSSGQLLYLAYDDVFDSPGSPGNTSTRTRYCRSR